MYVVHIFQKFSVPYAIIAAHAQEGWWTFSYYSL